MPAHALRPSVAATMAAVDAMCLMFFMLFSSLAGQDAVLRLSQWRQSTSGAGRIPFASTR
jgi:hypothetical protein